MALSLQSAGLVRQKTRAILRNPLVFAALKELFHHLAIVHGNRDLQFIPFDGRETDEADGQSFGLSAPHRIFAVWGKKNAGGVDSYLVGRDGASAGAFSGPSLGAAQGFGVLAGTTITNTGGTVVVGDIGVSPGSAITGFPPGLVVDGVQHMADTAAANAQLANVAAFGALSALASTETLAPGVVIGTGGTRPSFTAGVYDWATAGQLTGAVTLTGSATDVFVFRTGTTMITAPGASVVLAGGALPQNVYWQVGSSGTIDTTTAFIGNMLALTAITVNTGASVNGRLLAQTAAVTLDSNAITISGGSGIGDGRFSLPFRDGAEEAILLYPDGLAMDTDLTLHSYTTFDGLESSAAGDSPHGFVIIG